MDSWDDDDLLVNGYQPAQPRRPDLTTVEGLIEAVEKQAALLTTVSTGGERIENVNGEYKKRRRDLTSALKPRGLAYPFPCSDLWEWHGHWSSGRFPSYASRRTHIRELVAPTLDALHEQRQGHGLVDPGSLIGQDPTWSAVEARVLGLASELITASTKDDWQDVGRRCREIVIDCGRLLADPALVPAGQEPPKAADAKAWLGLYLARWAAGRSRDELRQLLKAAWDLAQKVTHGDLGRVETFAVAQATVLIVRTLQQLNEERQAATENGL